MRSTLLRLACALGLSAGLVPAARAADNDKDLVCQKVVAGSHWDSKKNGCDVCPKGFDPRRSRATASAAARRGRSARVNAICAATGSSPALCAPKAPGPLKAWPAGVCMKCPKPPADVNRPGERIRWAAGEGSHAQDHAKKGTQARCWPKASMRAATSSGAVTMGTWPSPGSSCSSAQGSCGA